MKVTTCQTDSIEDVIRILKGVGIDVDEGELEEEPKQDMDFGDVIKAMKARGNVFPVPCYSRRFWGKAHYIRIVEWPCPKRLGIIEHIDGYDHAYHAEPEDMLADDWYEVDRCQRPSSATGFSGPSTPTIRALSPSGYPSPPQSPTGTQSCIWRITTAVSTSVSARSQR